MRVRRVAIAAGLALLAAACGASEAVPETSGPIEGIAVHGDWTIDVLNEDGSLDQRAEFSNALSPFGPEALIQLMAGESSTGGNYLVQFGPEFGGLCPSESGGRCIIEVVAVGLDLDGRGPLDTLRLSGSTAAESDGTIEKVSTFFRTCGVNNSPAECRALGFSQGGTTFTTKLLPVVEHVPVSAGQTVQVQVDISFTSG